MRTLLDDRFAPITSAIGFLELPLADAADGLEEWRRSLYRDVTRTKPNERFPEMLHRLEPLTGGTPARELLVSIGGWTAYFDNGLQGTDPIGPISYLCGALRCQGVAIASVPHTVGPSLQGGRYGGVQFELFGPLPTDFLNHVRAIGVTFESEWSFDLTGVEQVFEEPEHYRSRRIRDRFTSEMLERYCNALGIDVFNADAYGPDATLFESSMVLAPDALQMTLAEVQRWLGITPGTASQLPG